MAADGLKIAVSGLNDFEPKAFAGAARHMVIQAGGDGHEAPASAIAPIETSRDRHAGGIREALQCQTRQAIVKRMRCDIGGHALIAAGYEDSDRYEEQGAVRSHKAIRSRGAPLRDRFFPPIRMTK